jgi:hypothetical protein
MNDIKWISILDRIPPIATDVLVLNEISRVVKIGFISKYPVIGKGLGVLRVFESMPLNYTDRIIFEATHWLHAPDKLDKSKWIKITDAPPKKEACVLFLDAYYTNDVFIGGIKDGHKHNIHGQFDAYRKMPTDDIYIAEATHYQLLPTIPIDTTLK